MATPKNETIIKLSKTQATVRFFDGTVLTVTDDGKISVKKQNKSYTYVPSRLRFNEDVLDVAEETSFWAQKIDINPEISLNIRTEKAERTRVELFFHERDGDETVVSGCFITKETTSADDWSINLVNTERFLFNLSDVLS